MNLTRTASGRLRVTHLDQGRPRAVFVDAMTGAPGALDTTSATLRTLTNLHRSWLVGDGGRLAAGLGALFMLVLSLTGLLLLQRSLGGWTRLFRRLPGEGMRRWHLELGRFAAAGLILSSATALHMSLVGFELIADGAADDVFVIASGEAPRPLATLEGLAGLTLADLREIVLPDPANPTEPLVVKTHDDLRFVDPASGQVLKITPHALAWHIRDIAYRLHTAEGMLLLALLLGLSAACGTLLSVTGLVIDLRKRWGRHGLRGNVPAAQAEILLLVGSEGGSTLGFGKALHGALTAAGRKVHLAPMNALPMSATASSLIVLAATAGNGEAPSSASQFLDKLGQWQGPKPDVMLVGFGDRQFHRFCAYAEAVETALRLHGFRMAMPSARIDRQSAADFAEWVGRLGATLGQPLALKAVEAPVGARYQLIAREDYGAEVQAPTAILRFRPLPRWRLVPLHWQQVCGLMERFEPGDLVAIAPPGEMRARFYSIASSWRSGVLEICVRHQPGGTCSGYLTRLQPGAEMVASLRPNPAFRPDRSARSIILIGAGAGIAPLVGFVREGRGAAPVHLYWGGRDPSSDFLFRDVLDACRNNGQLTRLRTVFSRIGRGGYVQDLIRADADDLRAQIAAGGQILICGGRDMAEGVARALADVLAPLGLDLATLRRNGRLLEDVY